MTHPRIMLALAFLIGFIAAAMLREPTSAEAFTGIVAEVINHHYTPTLKCERWVPSERSVK